MKKKILIGASVLVAVSCGLAVSFAFLGPITVAIKGTEKSDSATFTIEDGSVDNSKPAGGDADKKTSGQTLRDGRPEGDLVGRLQKVMPKGWKVDTAKLRAPNIQPLGRIRGMGSEIRLVHRSNPQASHPDARVVVWVMNKPSAPDPQSTDNLSDYLGEGRLGHVYLLAANVPDNPARHWLEYRGDIAVAMGAARRPRGTKTDIVWGKPADGLQAGIRFKALVDKPTPRVLLVLHLRNAGTKPIRILRLLTRVDYWGDHLPLEVKAGGNVLKYQGPELTPPPPPPVVEFIDLAAGATNSIEVTMKPELWGLKDPGGAEIAFVFTNRSKKWLAHQVGAENWAEVTGLWTGTARSGTITLDGTKTNGKGTPQPAVQPDNGRLPRTSLRLELHPRDHAPRGLYAIDEADGAARPNALLGLFRDASSGKIGKGCAEVVGRFETLFSPDDEFQFAELVRRGSRITADIRCVSALDQRASAEHKSCYVHAPLPAELPPGRYYVLIRLTEYVREGEKLVPALKLEICKFGYLTCFFDVPAKDGRPVRRDWLLPGSKVSLEETLKPSSFVVVCEAVNDAPIIFAGDSYVTQQDAKVLELLAGAAGGPKEFALKYYWTDSPTRHETFLSKGQEAIWIVSSHASSGKVYYVGDKALPDTPENREAVKAQHEVSRSSATKPQEASRLLEIRDRLLRAAKATRELRAKAVTQEEKTLQQWGMHLDHSQRIFPRAKHVEAYEKARPWAQYYCFDRCERAFAVEWSPPAISDAPSLRRLLDDPDPDVRSLAIEALGALHQPEDVGRIGKYLTDERETVASLDWAVQLGSINPPVFIERLNVRLQGTRPLQPWHQSDRYWYDMKVRDYAVRSLHLMTGFVFDANSFPVWWTANKNGRDCLWYWQQRFQRQWDGYFIRWLKERDTNKSVPSEEQRKAREQGAVLLRAQFHKETSRLSPEVEAKTLLLARQRSGTRSTDDFFALPLSLRLEPERLLDLVERKTSWPDVDWDRPGGKGLWFPVGPYDKPWWQKSNAISGDSLYGTMIDRLGQSADRLFKFGQIPRLQRLLEKHRSTGLMLGISRMLPPANADNLDDPVSRDGFLRSIVRGEDDAFFRGPVAAELVRVSLADNWPFLKETVFTEPPVPLNPDVRQSIIRALAEPPLTIGKRQKLVDLLLDPRSKTMLTANDERYRCDTQQAVNAHAGEELMSDELVRRLGDAETATEAWEQLIQKFKRLGADTSDRLPEDREKNLGETPTAMGTRSIEHHSGPSWLIGREGQHTAKQEE